MPDVRTLLITRPKEDAAELAAILSAKGFRCLLEPLLTIEPTATSQLLIPELERKPQAMLVTSKHALTQLSQLTSKRDVPLFIVGEASAAYAKKLGFTSAQEAGVTAEAFVKTVSANLNPLNGPLLYLRGEHISTDIAQMLMQNGFEVDSLTVYSATAATQFSMPLRKALETGDIDAVLFFSERSADIYTELAVRLGLKEAHMRISALCMSEPIAEKAGSIGWLHLYIATKPTRQAMVALTECLEV